MLYNIDAERISKVMKSRKVNQTDLASKCGVSRISINKAVNGKPCRYSTVHAISQALDIFPGYLLGTWNKQDAFTELSDLEGKPIYFDADAPKKKSNAKA